MNKKVIGSVVIGNVMAERKVQDATWGEQNHHVLKWLAILQEETGEAARSILAHDLEGFRREMVQVAAVAVATIECIDRGKNRYI
jgi:NTP pyrophosphatase (non-canonical NTP hydrolase)